MVYKWRDGARFKADAQLIGSEIESIGPRVSAESIVVAAKDATKELHKCFEWSNKKAATAYRLEQARLVIRSVCVVLEDGATPTKVRAYEFVSTPYEAGSRSVYVPISEVMSSEDLREQVFRRLSDTIAEASATARKYRSIIGAKAKPVERHLEAAGKALARAAS